MDQITKAIFAGRDFFLGPIHFHPVQNYSLPGGLDFGGVWNIVVLLVVYLIVGWVIAKWDSFDWLMRVGKSALWAGAVSNLADRLVLGFVRDFIDFNMGFVFNAADAFIVIGIILILLSRPKPKVTVNPLTAGI